MPPKELLSACDPRAREFVVEWGLRDLGFELAAKGLSLLVFCLAILPGTASAADPVLTTIHRDLVTSYTWGYKTGAKQQSGSYKNGRSLHAISRRIGSSGLDGSPDQIAWVDEHTGQTAAIQQATGYPEIGINPATSAVFSSDAPAGEQGRIWWALGGRAQSLPFDLVRSSSLFDPLDFELLLDNFVTDGDSTTPSLAVVHQTGLLAYRWLGSRKPNNEVRFREYDLSIASQPSLRAETTLARASAVAGLGDVTVEQLWTRWDPRHRALAVTWHWFARPNGTSAGQVFGSNPFLFTEDLGQSWQLADRTPASLPMTYGSTTPVSTPYDHIALRHHTGWEPRDIGFTPSGKPWITLPTGPNSPASNGWTMTFFRWTGSAWQGLTLSDDLQGNSDPLACGTTRDYLICAYSEFGSPGALKVRASRDDGLTWTAPITVHAIGAAANGAVQRINWVSFAQPADRYLDNAARFFVGYYRNGDSDGKFFKNSVRWIRIQIGPRADFDGNLTVDDSDTSEFGAAHAAADWRSDFNDDGSVDDQDLTLFTQTAAAEAAGGGDPDPDPDPDPGEGEGVFQQAASGMISIETEHADPELTGWVATALPEASSTQGIKAVAGPATSSTDGSQRAEYRVNFSRTGLHTVWLRMRGFSSTQNEVRFGINDGASANRATAADGAWTWKKLTTKFDIQASGVHFLRLYRKEQNVEVDKIVLVTTAYSPNGTGPPESERN